MKLDRDNDIHMALDMMNIAWGRGCIHEVVPDDNFLRKLKFNGAGTVVCQLQYGQCTAKYRVRLLSNGFYVTFRGRSKAFEWRTNHD